MLVTYFPVFRSLRDDAAEAGALLLLALFLHAALQLLQVGGRQDFSRESWLTRHKTGFANEMPSDPLDSESRNIKPT